MQALGGVGLYVCLDLLPRSDEVVGGCCPDTSVVDVDAQPLALGAILRGDAVLCGVEQLVVVLLRSSSRSRMTLLKKLWLFVSHERGSVIDGALACVLGNVPDGSLALLPSASSQ